MDNFKTIVSQNRKISPDYYEMSFLWKGKGIPQAGQFFTLLAWEESDPLLRRPFAFSDFDPKGGIASFIYQIRGKGTRRFMALKKGDELDVLGPLGKAFPQTENPSCLLGGGIGTGPMVFLANDLARKGQNPLLVLGYRSSSWIPQLNLEDGVSLIQCTDDGSLGFKGNVVQYLESQEKASHTLYACGPHPMLKACHNFSLKNDLSCYVSMEEIMACGIGACQGCAIKVTLPEGYLRVCKEGPVFDSRIIQWT